MRAVLPVFIFVLLMAPVSKSAPRIITLDDAINIALERNTSLQLAENGTAISELSVRQARLSFLPNLSVSAGGSNVSQFTQNATTGSTENARTRSLNVEAISGIVLFNGFRDLAQLKIAKLGFDASKLGLQRLQETTVLTVISQYLALIQSRRQLNVQQENLAAAIELNRQIEIYVETGDRPRADLYTQQSSVAGARLAVMDAQRSIQLAQVQLINILQLDPETTYEFQAPEAQANSALKSVAGESQPPQDPEAAGEKDSNYTFDPAELEALIKRALSQRKDVLAQQIETDAIELSIPLARPSRWPTISLNAGYGSNYSNPPDLNINDQLDHNRNGAIALNIQVPIFNFDSSRYSTRIARIQFENARISLRQAHQNAELEVRSAWLNYNSARAQYQVIEIQQRTAKLALDTANERYKMGAATLIELTQARVSYLQSESTLVNARYNLLYQRMALDFYVGDINMGSIESVAPR